MPFWRQVRRCPRRRNVRVRCEPTIFLPRLYFTTFPAPAPLQHVLNRDPSDDTKAPRIRAQSNHLCPPATPDDNATYYYFSVDHQLVYLSFFKDWGPLNLAMVYKACILIHELLEVRGVYLVGVRIANDAVCRRMKS